MRSRPPSACVLRSRFGITSACAEQTSLGIIFASRRRDHLRVCGADSTQIFNCGHNRGSPPRVRSRRDDAAHDGRHGGITSACAEQTVLFRTSFQSSWDHLRVCGADLNGMASIIGGGGSPPRVRSRLGVHDGPHVPAGITSACAEQTQSWSASLYLLQDHLRVCGADRAFSMCERSLAGSPPRVRSRLAVDAEPGVQRRITSACAEQTWLRLSRACLSRDHLRVCGADSR